MTMKKHFHVFSFLSILMLNLMSTSIHVFSHHHEHDDHDHDSEPETCELCEYAFLSDDLDYLYPTGVYEIVSFQNNFPKKTNYFTSLIIINPIDNFLFTRPPPSIS